MLNPTSAAPAFRLFFMPLMVHSGTDGFVTLG